MGLRDVITISEKGNDKVFAASFGDLLCGKSRFVIDTVLNDTRLTGLVLQKKSEIATKWSMIVRSLENLQHRGISGLSSLRYLCQV